MDILELLKNEYGDEIAVNVVTSYKEIEKSFTLERWKTAEIDAGHFVESLRRLLEKELKGTYTPFKNPLSKFSDVVLKQYEQFTNHESFRLIIPRVLFSIYCIRNKRGVGHIAALTPNKIDATLVLYNAKWVLAEIVRIKARCSIAEAQALLDTIIERKIELIWKENGLVRVLSSTIDTEDKILILLYDKSPQDAKTLYKASGYSNITKFKNKLRSLHNSVYLNYENGICIISPLGIERAEKIILSNGAQKKNSV